jgi:phenylalanyl-tRNA synthetase alpha chain
VLENCGINSQKYSGFAFGMGMDRIIMMRYGMGDVRFLYNGDLRVVNQF